MKLRKKTKKELEIVNKKLKEELYKLKGILNILSNIIQDECYMDDELVLSSYGLERIKTSIDLITYLRKLSGSQELDSDYFDKVTCCRQGEKYIIFDCNEFIIKIDNQYIFGINYCPYCAEFLYKI